MTLVNRECWKVIAGGCCLLLIVLVVGGYPHLLGLASVRFLVREWIIGAFGLGYLAWLILTFYRVRSLALQSRESDGMVCTYCGYDLRGIGDPAAPAVRCSECGRTHERATLQRYWEKLTRKWLPR